MPRTSLPSVRAVVDPLALFAGYFLAARLGSAFNVGPESIAAFWAPNSIALAALLRSPRRRWAALVAALSAAELASDLVMGFPALTAAGFATANALEVLVAARLLRSADGCAPTVTVGVAARFALFAVLLAPAVAALLGAAAAVVAGTPYGAAWGRWFVGDALAHLTLTPTILLWLARRPWRAPLRPRRVAEAIALGAGLAIAVGVAFGHHAGESAWPGALYLPLPLLLWAAIRFGTIGASTAVSSVALLALFATRHGLGPFTGASPAHNVLALQLFLVATALPLLALSVFDEDRRRGEARLREARDALEETVAERTAELDRQVAALREGEAKLREAHEVAEQARRAADAANQAKSDFLARMSHDVRTPLNAILGRAWLLERDAGAGPRALGHAAVIRRSGAHVLDLVQDLLELSRIEAGRLELRLATTHLHELASTTGELVRLEADEKGLDLRVDVGAGLPTYVLADEVRLRQVLLNLLGNAVKFTSRGEVVLEVRAARSAVSFAVIDTGAGIAAEELEGVFQPFRQGVSARTARAGVGLGLAISRQLVVLMGGELRVQSELGVGSRFWFELALEVAEAPVLRTSA
ncbi:MASE1 domain-containing protein [Anaeromyxobacter terrae]|uniref:MASE1 domain-containing protein n=1 Tax=Anaeromyxobacter terrae TaxID=2925406 RepID=UPI001F58F670|nr:MASE1 domain-containing protein [Anaeromyxobacter sp. SG22]